MEVEKEYPLVRVHWVDASADPEEHPLNKLPQLVRVVTTGYLIERGRSAGVDCIWVAQELCDDGVFARTFRGTTAIPAVWVQKIQRLEPVQRKKGKGRRVVR